MRHKVKFYQNKDLIIVLLLIIVYFAHRFFSLRLGLYMEECRDANAHLLVMSGKVPYKDFVFWIYGPFAFSVYPLIFKMFGDNLIVFRLAFISFGSLVIPLTYCLARRFMPALWSGMAAFLSVLLLDVPYYTYNHIFATLGILAGLLFVVKFLEDNLTYELFFAGIFLGMGILAKPFAMGLGALASILFFLVFLAFQKEPIAKIGAKHILALFMGILVTAMPFLVYFVRHAALANFIGTISPWGLSRSAGFDVYPSLFLFRPLKEYREFFKVILPYRIIYAPCDYKNILVQSYDRLVLLSPVIFPAAILLLDKLIFCRYKLISSKIKNLIVLFGIFSILISWQSLFYLQQLGRSFTSQVPFILMTYFLFLLNRKEIYGRRTWLRCLVLILTGLFVFYFCFLHFIRYPYSRSKKYTSSLNIRRAEGVRVTPQEKQLYETISPFLTKNTRPDEPIAVIGYFPQFALFSERRNVFGNMENITIRLDYLRGDKFQELESFLIKVLDSEKPRFLLKPVRLTDRTGPQELDEYIDRYYILEKTLGPAEIDIGAPGIVKVYRRKGDRG